MYQSAEQVRSAADPAPTTQAAVYAGRRTRHNQLDHESRRVREAADLQCGRNDDRRCHRWNPRALRHVPARLSQGADLHFDLCARSRLLRRCRTMPSRSAPRLPSGNPVSQPLLLTRHMCCHCCKNFGPVCPAWKRDMA